MGGEETHQLTIAEMPMHTHMVQASTAKADSGRPTGNVLAASAGSIYELSSPNRIRLQSNTVGSTIGGQAHDNLQPYLVVNVPVGAGGGAGLTTRQIGECGGEPTVTLLQSTMASHNHSLNSRPQPATSGTAGFNVSLATLTEGSIAYQDDSASSLTQLFPLTLDRVGGNEAHNNMQPYLALFFIICLEGIYPDLP